MQAPRPVALLAAVLLASGCLAGPSAENPEPVAPAGEASSFAAGGNTWTFRGAAGALSTLASAAGGAVALPSSVLVVAEDGSLAPAEGTVDVPAGGSLAFIAPWGVANLTLDVAGESVTLRLADTREGFVSGENVVRLLEVQRDQFPHRTPGMENYVKSQQYFADYFAALGYEVSVDPYGMNDLDATLPEGPGRGIGPQSFANVVATKKGTTTPERYIGFGGHYDVVASTRDGAFDDTTGTVAVLEIARALANVTTQHTMVFALWGGEEDGLLGSGFWAATNPEKMPLFDLYVNLDPPGLAWPGPLPNPDPVLVTAGPDGPTATRLHDEVRAIMDAFFAFDAEDGPEMVYEPMVVGGQVGGAGINAQSDHTTFAARGVPVVDLSTRNIDTVFSLIHSERDTVTNLTAYMATGQAPFEEALSPEEMAVGRDLLARSIEFQVWVQLHLALATDRAGLPV